MKAAGVGESRGLVSNLLTGHDELLRTSEVAKLLKTTRHQVLKMFARELVRLGPKNYRVRRSSLEAYVAKLNEGRL